MTRNLMLPGNPRYQPASLRPHFGYDNLYQPHIEVEWVTMEALCEVGLVPPEVAALMTADFKALLLSEITTTMVDERERTLRHDIRALVQLMQERMPEPLRRFVHVPLTSYDVISTAQALIFKRAYREVVEPLCHEVLKQLGALARKYAAVPQIGRTHGQHAVPITVGFWLAGIIERLIVCIEALSESATVLVGKVSGPVGAYNAQEFLGIRSHEGRTFEGRVLRKLGIERARVSTQIAPPEALSRHLFHYVQLSAVFGQFGRDCRHLMRSEVGEIGEAFSAEQVGSSTMAHKRNPVTFEGLEGAFHKSVAEFSKVLASLISEHQRDLVGSSLMRDFPVLVVNAVYQLETLLRKDKKTGLSFVERISVDEGRCRENMRRAGVAILAEPLYLALQVCGFAGDAHHFVNHGVIGALRPGESLSDALLCAGSGDALRVVAAMSPPERHVFDAKSPEGLYAGNAEEIAIVSAVRAEAAAAAYAQRRGGVKGR